MAIWFPKCGPRLTAATPKNLDIKFSNLTGPTERETLRVRHSDLSNKFSSWFWFMPKSDNHCLRERKRKMPFLFVAGLSYRREKKLPNTSIRLFDRICLLNNWNWGLLFQYKGTKELMNRAWKDRKEWDWRVCLIRKGGK